MPLLDPFLTPQPYRDSKRPARVLTLSLHTSYHRPVDGNLRARNHPDLADWGSTLHCCTEPRTDFPLSCVPLHTPGDLSLASRSQSAFEHHHQEEDTQNPAARDMWVPALPARRDGALLQKRSDNNRTIWMVRHLHSSLPRQYGSRSLPNRDTTRHQDSAPFSEPWLTTMRRTDSNNCHCYILYPPPHVPAHNQAPPWSCS